MHLTAKKHISKYLGKFGKDWSQKTKKKKMCPKSILHTHLISKKTDYIKNLSEKWG